MMSLENRLSMSSKTEPAPEYFYQRFNDGYCLNTDWPRITTEEWEKYFKPRDGGLSVLLINVPIREWSYPNIMPIGHGYIGSVIVMDGHRLDVLDLNAERLKPIEISLDEYQNNVEQRIEEKIL